MAITPKYQAYLNSDKWQRKRRKIFYRAEYRCEKCNRRQATQIHHKTYKRIFKERLSDLQAVCGLCHMEIHGIEDKPKRVRLFGGLRKMLAKVMG